MQEAPHLPLEQPRERGSNLEERIAGLRPRGRVGGWGYDFALLVVRAGGLLAVFYALSRWLEATGHLPAAAYEQPVIALGLLQRLLAWWPLLLVGAALAAWRWQWVKSGWNELEWGRRLRIFLGVIVFYSAWTFSTYDYNLFFDQAHTFDRLLLIGLAALAIWRPAFVLPFTLFLYAVIWQFDYPLTYQYPWTEMNMPIRILDLFAAAFGLRAASGGRFGLGRTTDFLFVTLCLIAAFYWGSGIGKLELGWIGHPYLHLLVFGAYANGWLGFLPQERVVQIVQGLAPFSLPLMLFTLFIEWGALLLLLRRGLALVLLLGFAGFHLGVFLYSGMLFWKWIVLELVFIGLFLVGKHARSLGLFKPASFALSLVIIGLGTAWFRPSNLSWYDTPAAYIYTLEGVTPEGERVALPPASFTPYSDTFTLNNFEYLNPGAQLTHLWDVTVEREAAEGLMGVKDLAGLEALETQSEHRMYNSERVALFEDFVRRYASHLNERGFKTTPFSLFHPPAHLWTLPDRPAFKGGALLSAVRVVQNLWFYDGREIRVVRSRVVDEIAIPVGEVGE